MGGGGDGDDGGVDFSGELAGIGECQAGVGGGDFGGTSGIGVDDGDEFGAGGLADNADVIAAYDQPFQPEAGIVVVKGNLALNGAVIKPSAATPAIRSSLPARRTSTGPPMPRTSKRPRRGFIGCTRSHGAVGRTDSVACASC